MVGMGLPAGTTIVVNPGVTVTVRSNRADAIFCEGTLSIKGTGTLYCYGSYGGTKYSSSAPCTGYAGDDAAAGNGITVYGRLLIGDQASRTGPYFYIYNGDSSESAICAIGNYTGSGNPLIAVYGGQVKIIAPSGSGKIYTSGTNCYMALYHNAVFEYPSKNFNYFSLTPKINSGNYYYATPGKTYYTVTYHANGGTTGAPAKQVESGGNADLSQTAAKEGKVFLGWNTSSTATAPLTSYAVTRATTLYAVYGAETSTIRIDLNGGRWTETAGAEFTETTSFTRGYGSTVEIPNPVRTGSTFAGWTLTNETDGRAALGLGKYTYTFGSESQTVILTAIWREATSVELVDNSQFTVEAEQLQNLFESSNLVMEPDKGITEEDIKKGSVNISVTVSDIENSGAAGGTGGMDDDSQAAVEAIQAAAGRLSPRYFDITVKKTVTPEGSTTAEEAVILTELPREAPAKVVIDVTGTDLEGKSSFYVYRYHNGSVEQLSYRNTDGEFYTVAGNIITIYTRKFSTYAVSAGEVSMSGDDATAYGNNSSTVDVQGKVTDAYGDPVYKLDVTWGAMKFEYGAAMTEWNPETHSYVATTGNTVDMGWLESGFQDGNNQIIVSNHSNADVLLSFAINKTGTGLDEVSMSVRQDESAEAAEATDLLLAKVPQEEAQASAIQAWFWIDGKPTVLSDYQKDQYTKVGVITMTVRTAEGSLTPRK